MTLYSSRSRRWEPPSAQRAASCRMQRERKRRRGLASDAKVVLGSFWYSRRVTSASVGAMELKFSGLSPYVRKVMIVAHEVGVADRLKLTPVKAREEPEKITPVNPLGKDSGAGHRRRPGALRLAGHLRVPRRRVRRAQRCFLPRAAPLGDPDDAPRSRTACWTPASWSATNGCGPRSGSRPNGSSGNCARSSRGSTRSERERRRLWPRPRPGLRSASAARSATCRCASTRSKGLVRWPRLDAWYAHDLATAFVRAHEAGGVRWRSASSTSASACSASAGAANS